MFLSGKVNRLNVKKKGGGGKITYFVLISEMAGSFHFV